jgi:hypothetical protein
LDRLGSKWLCCRWSGEFLHLGKGRCRMVTKLGLHSFCLRVGGRLINRKSIVNVR